MTFDRFRRLAPRGGKRRPSGSTERHRPGMIEIMDCYVYCLCAAPAPEIHGTFGIHDSQIRCIEFDGVVAVTADSSGCPERSVPNVIAHNRVVNSVLQVTTPVPCRFGTVLSRRDLGVYVETNSSAVKNLLERVRGCVEITLRVTQVPQSSERDADNQLEEEIQARSLRLLPESGGPGTRFLEEKLRQAAHQEVASRQAQAILQWAKGRFEGVVKDSIARLRPEATLMADIAQLVDRARLDAYHDLFRSAARDRADLRLSISGPWAPYSFAVFDSAGP